MNKTDNIYKIQFLQSLGFTPISNNLSTYLEVKCQQGHIFKRQFANFKRGNVSCPKCEEAKKISFFNGTGFKFIKDHQIICPYGHTINRSFSAMIKSKTLTCPECSKNQNKEKIQFLKSLLPLFINSSPNCVIIGTHNFKYLVPSGAFNIPCLNLNIFDSNKFLFSS